jgi:uncharacterized protein (TIGR03083 family)
VSVAPATDLVAAATAERTELAGLLASLDRVQWDLPSPCAGWSVRDVAVHVISYDDLPTPRAVATLVRSLGSVDRASARTLARWDGAGPAEVVQAYRTRLQPRGLTALGGARIGFLDGLIHHQDVRRAVGRPREVPPDRLLAALAAVRGAPVLPARGLVRGLRLVADDVPWEQGDGAEVHGPGEALLLTAAGRDVALGELRGDGLALLTERVRAHHASG